MKLKKFWYQFCEAIANISLLQDGSSKSSSKDGETTVKVGVMTLEEVARKKRLVTGKTQDCHGSDNG